MEVMEQELVVTRMLRQSFWQCIRKVHVRVPAGHVLQVRSTSCYKACYKACYYSECFFIKAVMCG